MMRRAAALLLLLCLASPAFAEQPSGHLGITPEYLEKVIKAGTEKYADQLRHPKGKLMWALNHNKENVAALLAEERNGMISRIQVIATQYTGTDANKEHQEANTMGAILLLCGGMAVNQGDMAKTSAALTPLKQRLDKEAAGIVAASHEGAIYILMREKTSQKSKEGLILIIIPAVPALE